LKRNRYLLGGKGREEKRREEERREREKNQTQLRLAYPKPKLGKEIHKKRSNSTSLLLLTKDMSSPPPSKRLSPKPDFLDSGE